MKNIVLLFIRIHYFLRKWALPIRGLVRAQNFLNESFVFEAFNRKFYFSPSIEGSYDYLLIGKIK